ncbi:M18 family aminopeptidase [Spirochaetia bacterium]|nr:M18 family aminopeptidase [Spirochaetia bacterium]
MYYTALMSNSNKDVKNLLLHKIDGPGPEEIAEAGVYCKGYMDFLDSAKNEREAVSAAIGMAEKNGFVPWENGTGFGKGGKVYTTRFGKAILLAVRGRRPLTEGFSIIGAHIDSPRLDLKMKPLYEDRGLAFFDTHYYGGIKNYQWTGIPLALHGYIVLKDGQGITVSIGENPEDPVFFIADLLPHLAKRQMEKPGKELIEAENLDLLAGLYPYQGEPEAGAIKLNILHLLHAQYGVTEDDLISAELQALPAFKARDLGLDRSMIGAYGHDDKVCSYPALTSLFSLEEPEFSALVVLADKEETGSWGISSMRSEFFKGFIAELVEAEGKDSSNTLNKTLANSFCLSADVNTAYYPLYSEVFDPHGEAAMGNGVVLFRYWGTGGKENTNDADAKTVAALRKILDNGKIRWQTGEGGRVDAEESGTLSKFFAGFNIPTVDLGVPLLSMHSPFEAAAKTDVLQAHRAFTTFFSRKQ